MIDVQSQNQGLGVRQDVLAFDFKGRVVSLVLITPEMAREWIEWTDVVSQEDGVKRLNRRLVPHHVADLRRNMDAGKWDPLFAPIHLDEKGALLNGQHRSHAIMAHGAPVYNLVVRNMPRSSLIDLDGTVRPRGVACQLEIGLGFHQAKELAAGARALMALAGSGRTYGEDVKRVALVWQSHLAWAHNSLASSPFQRSGVVGTLAWVHATYPEHMETLAAQLTEREMRSPLSPARALDRALRSDTTQNSNGRSAVINRIHVTSLAAKHQVAGNSDVRLIKAVPTGTEWARRLQPSVELHAKTQASLS